MSVISINPQILGGTPCFSGTRVPIDTFLDYMIQGYTTDYFLSQFPTVTPDQVRLFLESMKREVADHVEPAKL